MNPFAWPRSQLLALLIAMLAGAVVGFFAGYTVFNSSMRIPITLAMWIKWGPFDAVLWPTAGAFIAGAAVYVRALLRDQ